MALPIEAFSYRDRSHLTLVHKTDAEPEWQQSQLMAELPWRGRMSPLDPDAYARMSASDGHTYSNTEVWTQINLPHLERGMVEPEEYHKEYPTVTGSAYYATDVRYNPENGSMEPTGRNTILASGDIFGNKGEVLERTTVHVGYENWEATYVAVNRQDLQFLGDFYQDEKRRVLRPPTSEISQFSGPFGEGRTFPVDANEKADSREYLYLENDQLVLERVDPTSNLSRRVELPFRLDAGIYKQLVAEGKSSQARDSDDAFIQEVEEPGKPEEHTVFQVPQKYPVVFSSKVTS